MINLSDCFKNKFELLKKNIEESKRIRILAHYDVDGVSAAAIIFNTFKGKDFHISFVKNL